MTTNAFCESLKDQVVRYVPGGARVVLGVSGGPDSLALLYGFNRFAVPMNISLIVAHFDHALRADSSDDAEFVRSTAQTLDLPFYGTQSSLDLTSGSLGGVEESCRKARYAFFRNVAQRTEAKWIATGHTRDDQVETVLAAVLRGTGLHGLSGIPIIRHMGEGLTLLRPLLDASRAQIDAYLKALGVKPCVDSSNDDRAYTRNRIRHELLPLLRATYNPKLDEALLRLGSIAERSSNILRLLARTIVEQSTSVDSADCVELDVGRLGEFETELIAETVRYLFEAKQWPRKELGMREIDRIVGLVNSDENAAWDLPNNMRAERTASTLRISIRR